MLFWTSSWFFRSRALFHLELLSPFGHLPKKFPRRNKNGWCKWLPVDLTIGGHNDQKRRELCTKDPSGISWESLRVFGFGWFWGTVFEIMLLASSHLRWCFYKWSPVARLNSSSFHWVALNKLMLQQKWWLGDYPYLLVLSLLGDGTFPVASCSNFWAVKLCSDQGCNFCHAFVWLQIAGDVIVFCLAMGQCHYDGWSKNGLA